MRSIKHNNIFALSSTFGQSAIAIFRISGNETDKIAKLLTNLKKINNRYAHYTKIYDLNKKVIDKCVILFFKGPNSFTGEDLLEIHSHGSIAVINKISDTLSKIPNTREADPGEFSKRAFQNGKANLLFFEGINNLIKSETENQLKFANQQVYGGQGENCKIIREKITKVIARLNASIEFSEETDTFIDEETKHKLNIISIQINNMCKSYQNNKTLVHGQKILIIGPTNAGKSSFFNFLLQEESMIVSSISGTTTDQAEKSLNINGKKVIIIDSAGIRASKKQIEIIGIQKTLKTLEEVQSIILVLSPDSLNNSNLSSVKHIFHAIKSKKCVVVYNKLDKDPENKKLQEWKNKIPEIKKYKTISLSCKKKLFKHNILLKTLKFLDQNLLSIDTNNEGYYFSERRHIICLNNMKCNLDLAIDNIESVEICTNYLRDAVGYLDELYGKYDNEKELGFIFNEFCIGK
ncbi:MAG: tRNA uridine-5-carboxymethylaminomethyl(34) synthesis GTPase MnmE [Alphaproteobacteria bacterium]